MNAAKSSYFPDPFIDILPLHFPTDLRKILNDSELQAIIDTFDLPKLQASDIASISEKLSQGKSYNDAIHDHSYQFPFRPSALTTLVNKCPQDGTKRAHFAVCFILHSYVSFCLLLEKNCSLNYLPVLLQALYTIINITPLATEAFIRALSYYAKKRDFYQLKIYVPLICDFFRNANLKNVVAFDIFAELFNGLTSDQTTNVCEDAYEFFTLIASTAEEKSHVFPKSAAIKIMNSLKHLIIDMDFHTLDMASHVGSLLGQEYVSELCKLIIPVVINRIVKEPPTIEINFQTNSSNSRNNYANSTKLEPPEQILEPILQFTDDNTFSNGFNVVSRERLPERDDIISLCKPEILANRIGLFLKIIQHYEESTATFLDTFQDSISVSIKNRHFFDMMAHFLEAGLELSHNVKLPNMVRFLFSDILFDPKLICSIEDTNSYKLNSLRGAAFELILNEGPTALDAVLIESMPHPELFTEIIYRCLVYRSSVISILPQSTKLLNTIITSTLYYQNYCFKGYSNIDTVRLAVFLFFSSLFNDKEIETFIFSNSYFISAFLSFMFEEPVRPFITNQLRAFLTKDNQKVMSMIGEEITKIMEIARPEFPSLRSVSLADDILVTIIEALSHQYSLAEIFRPVIGSIVESLAQLANTKECQFFFLNTLQFFAGIAHDFTLSIDQLYLIETAISTVFEDNPPQPVFNRLVQILAADCIITVGPTFLIRQPLALPVFFRTFQRTSRYKEVIMFILDLCSNAASNSIACHTCGLDEYLLESIEEKWYDEDIDVEIVELILSLFSKISFSISSPNVVSRFVSLLSPMNDQFLPICFDKILLSLNTIVSSTLKCPETSIPLPQIPIPMQRAIDPNQGFTFVAWIEMESITPQYKPVFFTFSDGCDINFKISLSSNIIITFQRTSKSESNARADKELPLSQWAFVSITYRIFEGNVILLVSINCQDSRNLQFPMIDFNGKLATFTFFGVAPDSVQPEIPVLIGPFALFPILDKITISHLYGHGPRQLNRVPIQPHYTYVPQSNQIHSISTTTFLKVLIKNCKLTILLPLFSLIDYKTIKGEMVNNITDITIEMISNALLMSNQTEIEFANLHGFEMLSALLMSTDFSRLNYSMYLRFFSLMQLLRTGDLQQQLLRCIIGNIDLWIVTNAENQLRILKHWSRVLFLTNSPTDNFSTFLNNTVLFYWDDVHNRDYLKGMPNSARPRPKDLNVFECRQFMTIILLTMSQKKFLVNDFYLLMALCKKCPDKGTVLSLVHLVLLMAKTRPSPLSIPSQNENFLPLIHQLFQRRWSEITRMMIEIICMLHVNQIIVEKPTFEEHIEIIIHHLTPKDITEDIFVYLYKKLLPSIPQLLPLCYWFAFNISNDAITKLVDETVPSILFATSSHWAKWPIIVASQTNDSVAASILVFLAKCGHKEWVNLFSTIIIVSKSLEKDYNLMLCIFLTYLSNCLLCRTIEHTPENLTAFFEIVRHFLFFRDTKEKQKELETAFKYSPFHDVPRGTPDSPRKENFRARSMLPTDLITVLPLIDNEPRRKFMKARIFTKQIQLFKSLPEKYDFGVRLDDRLRWSDFTLAQNTIHLIRMAGVSEALDIDLVICTFILKSHPSIVQAHLRNLKLPPNLIHQNQKYIDLLCFKAMRLGIVCPFYNYRSQRFDTNSSKALFETSKWDLEKFVSIPKTVLRSIKKFYKSFSQIEPSVDLDVDEIYDCFLKIVKRSLSDKNTEMIENSKLYRQLWYSITQPGALWQNASIENSPESRDMIGCFAYSPFRTKNQTVKNRPIPSIRPNFIAQCEIIKNLKSIKCEYDIFENRIELISCENQRRVIYYKDIKELLRRTRFHQKNSIEIFLFNNKSYFICFFTSSSKFIVNLITKYEPRLFRPLNDISEISNLWINRKITNFEYLMALNKESGRSFNDLTQYPIFPWIIKDYVSESIKLKDTSLYRELLRPIGTLNDERIKKLRTFSEDQKTGLNFGYLYKSAPSSNASTLSFLGNLLPYSETSFIKKEPESDKFRSIFETFKTVTSEKEDFRELIPEFFFCPEIFQDVALPPWAKSTIEFVYFNRKALESDHTSSTLNNWIDLMWGIDSRGRDALKHENTFRHELYDSVWKTEGDLSSEEIIDLMQEKGIMPRQLFTVKHPQRIPLPKENKKLEPPMTINATSNSIAFCNIESIPNEDRIVLLYIDAAGILKRDAITFNRISDKIVSIRNVDTSMLNIDGFNFVSDNTRFVYISNNYLLASEDSTLLLDTKNLSSTTFLSDPSQCLTSSYPYFVTINGEFIINVFHISDLSRPKIVIPYVRTYALCATISSDFHMIVVGAENEMMIYSIIPGALSRRIALDNMTPLLINVTPSWGFIVVFAVSTTQNNNNSFNNSGSVESIDNFITGEERFLLTFTVNGELIRKVAIPYDIVAMTSWKSDEGFDFIAFSNTKGKIYICEAFYLDVNTHFMKCQSDVREIAYAQQIQMLIIIAKDGTFIFQPYVAKLVE